VKEELEEETQKPRRWARKKRTIAVSHLPTKLDPSHPLLTPCDFRFADLDELDDILNAIDDDQHGDVAALDDLFEAPVLLPGELQGTDAEVMAFKFEDLADEDFNPEDFEDDDFEGDPLLIGENEPLLEG